MCNVGILGGGWISSFSSTVLASAAAEPMAALLGVLALHEGGRSKVQVLK